MKTTVMAAAILAGLSGAPAAAQGSITWTDSVLSLGLDTTPGRSHKATCPPDGALGAAVWGDGEYAYDSAVCVAALHAGLITMERGGSITIEIRQGLEAYTAARRNGVATRPLGPRSAGFAFPEATETPPLDPLISTVTWTDSVFTLGWEAYAGRVHFALCPPGGVLAAPVWGDGPYTHDSAICVAAVHAGLFGPNPGGVVRIALTEGGDGFAASVNNGVGAQARGFWLTGMRLAAADADLLREARQLTWRDTVQGLGLRQRDGERFVMYCPPGGATDATIWGDGVYIDDSPICVAAVHAGVIASDLGGVFAIVVRPGQDAYASATRNGVRSTAFPAWGGSFEVAAR